MKNTIIKGTFILSAAGILTRLIGFYYRIFLSNTIGAEGIGLYQMIFPMYGLCISFAVTGIQMAISKFTAEAARTDPQKTFGILKAGLYLSFFLSVFISILLYVSSDFIASCIISDARCGHLLKLSAFAIPFCSIHGCIIGYFLGKSRTVIPAAAQLGEQLSRVGIVFFLSLMTGRKLLSPDAAMAGLFFGEFASSLICIIALISDIYKYRKNFSADLFQEQNHAVPENYKKEILSLSSPIAFSRVITSVLLSLPEKIWPQPFRIDTHIWNINWNGYAIYLFSFHNNCCHLFHDSSLSFRSSGQWKLCKDCTYYYRCGQILLFHRDFLRSPFLFLWLRYRLCAVPR